MATARSQVSPRTVWTVGLNVLALLALWAALGRLRTILTLVLFSALVALALDVPVRGLQRQGLKRGWAVLVASLALLGVFVALVLSLVPLLVGQLELLAEAAPRWLEQLGRTQWFQRAEARFGLQAALGRSAEALPALLAGTVLDLLSSTAGLLAAAISLFVLVIFMLLFGGDLLGQLLDWLSPARRAEVASLLGRMREAVGGFLAGTLLQVSIGAGMTALVTLALGVPYFLALGLSYLVLGFIPYAGSAVVALLVSLTTLATVGLKRALIALAIFLVYQQVEGNVLGPLIQQRTIRMNPLLITLVVLVGAGLFGVLGAVMALPLAAALQVVLRQVHEERRERQLPVEAPERPAVPPVAGTASGSQPSPGASRRPGPH